MDEALIKKTQPYSAEAERAVISSMLMDKDVITAVSEILVADDFYQRQYGSLYDAMIQLHNEGKPVDLVTLKDKLIEMAMPPELSSVEFIRELMSVVPNSLNAKYYAGIVRDKSQLRKLIKVTEQITNTCYLGNKPVADIMAETEKDIFHLLQNQAGGEFQSIKEVVIGAIEGIERAAKTAGKVTGIASGFYDLDYKTAGFHPSDLILVAARPAMGKTAFVLNIAEHAAVKENIPTAIFSLEMSKEQLVKRILSMNSKVDSQAMRTGELQDDDWIKLVESAKVIGNSNLILDDTPGITISELRSKCRKYKLEFGLGMIIIDYLQLMQGSKGSESRQQEISEIFRSLKALARELNVPVIALSQLSRAVEQRPDKRPMLSDLRESGAIEQDADMVMFIYRDDYYNKDSEEAGISEIIIGKQRSGPTGTVKLAWLSQYTKFANLERSRG